MNWHYLNVQQILSARNGIGTKTGRNSKTHETGKDERVDLGEKATPKRRRKPSTIPDASPSRSPTGTPPPIQKNRPISKVRLNGIGHFPEFDDKISHSQTRCKFPKCKVNKTLYYHMSVFKARRA
jgi:hypothetical protein